MTPALIGTLNHMRVPVVFTRGRTLRDFSGVVRGGVACRAMVDRDLEQRLAGEKAVEHADATWDAVVEATP